MTGEKKTITPGAYRFTVCRSLAGQRLDQYLSSASENFSRGMAKKIIDLGGVHYAGRRMRRCSQVVEVDALVEVFVDDLSCEPMILQDDHILFRDKDLIVINKPAGMPTQPTPARFQGTVYSELIKLLSLSSRRDLRPSIGMVQRLDRDTSGALVFSIHKRAHKKLTEQFQSHRIEKKYWALVSGHPGEQEGTIISHLAKRRSTNLMVSVAKGGKRAETRYRVLQSNDSVTLVDVELVTGRSHQIRVHFSENGNPLLGDKSYGGATQFNDMLFARQMLHAREITFLHPVSNREMNFEAPLPNDFRNAVTALFGSLNDHKG